MGVVTELKSPGCGGAGGANRSTTAEDCPVGAERSMRPASIYMGDAGAMFIGLMLGALSMIGKYTESHSVSLLTPVLILGMPIFDTLFVMYIRFLRGLPVFLGSPDHVAIRLRHWGLSVTQVVLISYFGAALLGGIGLLVMAVPQDLAMLFSGVTLLCLGVAAVALTRVNVSGGAAAIRAESVTARSTERTGAV